MLYEWLKDYQKLEEEISYLEFNLERTERELKRWTSGDLYGVKLQPDSLGAKVEDVIDKINADLNDKYDQRKKLVDLVSKFKGIDNKILKLKYIDGLTLERIAEKLNYSDSHIRKKHAELIRTVKFVEMYHLCSRIE
jgi:DNA-directed RNA polymerase specialized sigma subunit